IPLRGVPPLPLGEGWGEGALAADARRLYATLTRAARGLSQRERPWRAHRLFSSTRFAYLSTRACWLGEVTVVPPNRSTVAGAIGDWSVGGPAGALDAPLAGLAGVAHVRLSAQAQLGDRAALGGERHAGLAFRAGVMAGDALQIERLVALHGGQVVVVFDVGG